MQLTDPISKLPMVGPRYETKLEKLGISSIEDLLLHIPSRYKDFRITTPIRQARIGDVVTIKAEIKSMKNIFTKTGKRLQIAEIADESGTMQALWFNQMFLTSTIKAGMHFSFSGKVSFYNRKVAFISPEYENLDSVNAGVHTGRLVPVYPETAGVSSKWLRQKVTFTYQNFKSYLTEFLPKQELQKLNFIGYNKAIEAIQFPQELEEVHKGRERLAFNELLFHQLKSLHRKLDWSENKTAHHLKVNEDIYKEFTDSLHFELTNSQKRSVEEIYKDLIGDKPMNRLLEGDVGSGKTAVAAAACFASFINGYQSIVMAPTQILAEQHYVTLNEIFKNFKVRVSLITSTGVKSGPGNTDIYVGTHALIHKKVKFNNVALVVIDEQHRFGVEQRAHLLQKSGKRNIAPHILTMTATPIPRTIALTVYGDLDLSTLDELPKGRQPITTWLIPPQKREGSYKWIDDQIERDGIQVFIICPLIDESQIETMKQVKAVTQEYEAIKKIFNKRNVGLLHGKQNSKLKTEVLDNFKNGKTDILVATPVVEVGIDIPNATIMIIEAAERFGLSQLHQLRGRIGRGTKKSYCLLFTDVRSPKVIQRLNALQKTMSGFELAEYDLKMRGPGEIFGIKQHGFPELKIATWQDTELIKSARELAQRAIKNPDKFPELIAKVHPNDVAPN